MAGFCTLGPFKTRCAYHQTAEMAVYLHHEYTGKGLGATAIDLLEEHARKNGFHVIIVSISQENTASKKLVERKGYEQVAHYREVGFKFGRFLDVVNYQKILD